MSQRDIVLLQSLNIDVKIKMSDFYPVPSFKSMLETISKRQYTKGTTVTYGIQNLKVQNIQGSKTTNNIPMICTFHIFYALSFTELICKRTIV